jgi:predicted enzyme related to lactoylglutathione lyase
MTTHALSWVEIPVLDFDRAKAFYSRIFDFAMPQIATGSKTMGFLRFEPGKGVGGAIVKSEGYQPSAQGALVYLAAGKDLSVVLHRVVPAGGLVQVDKTPVGPDLGFYAVIFDTEGNRLALHSPN